MQDFTKLKVWKRAHSFVLDVYRETRGFPRSERYGLMAQIRRSATSIPSNLAEGSGRGSRAEFARFVDYALGSANETDYHLILSRDLGFMQPNTFERLIGSLREIRKMTTSLSKTLRRSEP